MSKICPLMSRMVINGTGDIMLAEADCKKDRCQFWIEVLDDEGDRVKDCCHTFPNMNSAGMLVA